MFRPAIFTAADADVSEMTELADCPLTTSVKGRLS